MDTAQLVIRFMCPNGIDLNNANEVQLFMQNDECHKCPMASIAKIAKNSNETVTVQTRFPTSLKVVRDNAEICNFKYQFTEGATYKFIVSAVAGNTTSCSDVQEVTSDGDPHLRTFQHYFTDVFYYLFNLFENDSSHSSAILVAFIIFLGLSFLWAIGKWLVRKYHDIIQYIFFYQQLVHADLGNPAAINAASSQPPSPNTSGQNVASKAKARVRSLDTFRGLSLIVMVFVNYGGGGYWFFEHSAWDGLTVADLLFPWFVWIMGAAIAFAFRGPFKRGESRILLFFKVCKRTAILFMLGIIVNTSNCHPVDLSKLRILGVLQRLAISYFFVATLELLFGQWAMTLPENREISVVKSIVMSIWDLVGGIPQWIFILALVTVHTCITFLLPVPGCPTGYLGPGGLSENGMYYNCTGGAARYVDEQILGFGHMYGWPTCKDTYKTVVSFEPEGVLGCLTSIIMCYLGLHAGRIFTLYPTDKGRIIRWLIWGAIWGLIGGSLCGFSQYNGVIPVNKNLWSLSFILTLSSMALILLSLLYFICDVLHLWSGAPFIYPGMNSIVVYMGHELLASNFPVTWAVDDDSHAQRLAINLWGVSLWTIVAAIMHYKKVFISI